MQQKRFYRNFRKGIMQKLAGIFKSYWIIIVAIFMLGVNWATMKGNVAFNSKRFEDIAQSNNQDRDVVNTKLDTVSSKITALDGKINLLSERVACLEGSMTSIQSMLFKRTSLFGRPVDTVSYIGGFNACRIF